MPFENISLQLADIFVSAVGDAVSEISAGLGVSELPGELSGTARISAGIFGNEFISALSDTAAEKNISDNFFADIMQMYKNDFSYPGPAEYSGMYKDDPADNVSANSAGFASGNYLPDSRGFSGNKDKYDRIILNADIDLTTFLDGKVIAENTAEYIREFNRRSDGYGE